MPLKRLAFIRSGETDWNLSGRWQGWVASPLNEHGQLQMQRLANFVRHLGLSALYSSDSARAKQSAEILVASLDFEPIYDGRLRERSIGFFQGLTVPEIHGWYKDEYQQLLADPENYKIPLGESLHDVSIRAKAALDDIIKAMDTATAGDITVGILSHTTTTHLMIKALIPDLPNIDDDALAFANSSVTTVGRTEDGWKIIHANDLSHLEGLESRYMPSDVRGDDI
jgi:broad specificity phosphatase PhoE